MELIADTVVNLLTNGLVFFTAILGGNFGLGIIFFTIISRIVLYPLTAKQLRSTRAMQLLQPRINELKEKYKNDQQKVQREQMRLFREAGVNPLGCLGPMIVQMPVFIGLFYAIRKALADTPEGLVSLEGKLWSWLPLVNETIPLNSTFLGMDLGLTPAETGGGALLLMPLLVGGSMYVVQKMTTQHSTDPRQNSMSSMMSWMLPIMFGFWTLSFPNGLAVYWIGSNVVSIFLQYRVTGWGSLFKKPVPAPAAVATRARRREDTVSPDEDLERRGRDDPPRGQEPQPTIDGAGSPQGEGSVGGFLKRVLLGNPQVTPPPGRIVRSRSRA